MSVRFCLIEGKERRISFYKSFDEFSNYLDNYLFCKYNMLIKPILHCLRNIICDRPYSKIENDLYKIAMYSNVQNKTDDELKIEFFIRIK